MTMTELYKSYETLGGNGEVAKAYKEVLDEV
jgi:hypothetical protein